MDILKDSKKLDKINTKIIQDDISDFELKAERMLNKFKKYHVGKKNSITARNMSAWGSPRYVRAFISYLRMKHEPICSSSRGYYYAESQQDIDDTIKFILDPRIEEIVKALKQAQKTLPKI